MSGMLEVVLAFMGVMLILAFAAQAFQEVLKAALGLKGWTRQTALRNLVTESAVTKGLDDDAANDIVTALVNRLRGLGQNGVRSKAVRLDHLTPDDLADLIRSIPHTAVHGLKTEDEARAKQRLECVASQAKDWFHLAMTPTAERHARRMRGWAVFSSIIIVLALNADAIQILHLAQTDQGFRTAMTEGALQVRTLDSAALAISARVQVDTSLATAGDSARLLARQDSIGALRDSLDTRIQRLTSGFLVGRLGDRRWADPAWWLGIVLSVFLVAMGAPFWNDILGSVLGLKHRITRGAAPEEMHDQSSAGARAPAG